MIKITSIEYRHRCYWAVSGVNGFAQQDVLRSIPGTFFSRSQRCWLISRGQLTIRELESLLGVPNMPILSREEDNLAQSLIRIYRSAWRVLVPITNDMLPRMKTPKSLKYRCILRLLYSHFLSISQVCSIKLSHCNGADTALEIIIPSSTYNKIQLDSTTSLLIKRYILESQPEIYLFESQPGLPYPEEKMHRGLLRSLPKNQHCDV